MSEAVATMVDVAFPLGGASLPREHAGVLADALAAVQPWLDTEPGVGVHRVKVVAGDGSTALLSQRARLVLRVPRARAGELAALARRELDLGGHTVRLGAPVARELLPHRTLYAEFVVTGEDDELAFLDAVGAELRALDVACGCICGRERVAGDAPRRLAGFSLMLDGLSVAHSLRILEAGIGAHRRLGCGLFVPHRSAAAVGA